MEKKLSKSLVASMRCDARSVVELLRFFEEKGFKANALGTLLRQSVEALAVQVRTQRPDLACETHLEAYQELIKRHLIHDKSRGHDDLLGEISLERMALVGEPTTQTTPQQTTGHTVTPEQVKRVIDQMQTDDDDGGFDLSALSAGKPKIAQDDGPGNECPVDEEEED